MGVDSIKSGGSIPTQPKQVDDTQAAEAAAAAEATPAAAPSQQPLTPSEGFDDPKAKPVSVTGGYKSYKPSFEARPDLEAEVASQRIGSAPSKPLQDKGGVDTIASQGAAPAPRKPDADFVSQAKAKGLKKPDEIEAKAIELGKAKIEKDFGMKVKDGDANWSSEELSRAYESFKSMPKADQAKLKDLELIRDHAASPESQAEMKNGVVAGEYNPNTKTTDGKRDKPGSISAYDAAFPSGPNSRQSSISVLTHEAGHAVEGRDRDDKMTAWSAANDVRTKAVKDQAPIGKQLGSDWKDFNKANKQLGTASLKDKPKLDFVKAEQGVIDAAGKMQNAKTDKDFAAAKTALDAAVAKRDAALAGASGTKWEAAANNAVAKGDAVVKSATDFAKASVEVGKADAVLKTKTDDLKTVATVTVTKKGKTTITSADTSNELAAFKAARGKEKPVSGYGAGKSAEGYAEAYALYQRDPSYMSSHFPKQYAFFHANHQSPNDP